ncbi:hypothetical protein IFR05_010593 [Cadophora sp. M221]|nr:hypothetical protein IFR05_010593 [Cadophora sp. M221]
MQYYVSLSIPLRKSLLYLLIFGLRFCQGSVPIPGESLKILERLGSTARAIRLDRTVPFATTKLLNNYLGIPFNSPNNVVRTSDGALWFTGPQFGFLQNIRPNPQLPLQVYRWVPETTDIRVVADGLAAPNGIGFSADEKIAYLADTKLHCANSIEDCLRLRSGNIRLWAFAGE